MSREQFLCIVYYELGLDPVLKEAIEILDAQLSQLQQPQMHHIQQQTQDQQPAQEQKIPIPENLSNESDSDSDSKQDNEMDLVFGIKRNITLQIPHGLTRGSIIYENNRSNFNRDH